MRRTDKQASLPHRFRTVRDHWPDLILIIILALLPLLFFWRIITPNPADRMQIVSGDFTEQYFPLRAFAAQEWVQGRIPFWNPYLYGGQPALADIQSGALYPPHVMQALTLGWGGPLLGGEVGFPLSALAWQVIVHFSLAAVGTYLFVRYLGHRHEVPRRLARFGGVIASIVFTYSGYLTGFPVQQLTILEVSAWLPWVLWGLSAANSEWRMARKEKQEARSEERRTRNGERVGSEERGAKSRKQGSTRSYIPHPTSLISMRSVQSPVPRPPAPTLPSLRSTLQSTAWGGLAFALAILAGHPQSVLYIFYLTLAYALFRGGTAAWDRSQRNPEHRFVSVTSFRLVATNLVPWLGLVSLGSILAAAQLLPTLEFIARSLRADLSYRAVSSGLPLNEFVSILYPGFFGGSPEYVGIASLVLIGLALVLARPRREIFFWAGAGLISFILAFGNNTFLYSLFYLFAPGFEAVRQQERAFLVYSFSAAILAGYGAIVLAGPLSKSIRSTYLLFEQRLRVVLGVALALTAFFIYGSAAATARGDEVNLFFGVLWHHLFGLLMLAGMVLFLALRPRRWLRRWWGMSLITLWLIFNLFTVNWRFNLEEPANSPPFSLNGVVQFLQSQLQSPRGASNLQPLPPGRIASGGLLPGGNSAASVFKLQDLTGNTPLQLAMVDAFFQQMPSWRLWQLMNVRYIVADRELASDGLSLVFEEGEHKVFEMGDPFPRAWLVSAVVIVSESSRAIPRLAADDFDLRTTAVVPAPLNAPLGDASTSSVSITNFSPVSLTVQVETASQQLLVLSQNYYPGWQVTVDGQPAELLRVNVIQQGVVVPAGSHTVKLTYWPRSFGIGLMISTVGTIIWTVMIILSKRTGTKKP